MARYRKRRRRFRKGKRRRGFTNRRKNLKYYKVSRGGARL